MKRPLPDRVHGLLDYALVAVFLNAPMVLGFHGAAAAVVYWLAGIHLLLTGFTKFPLGVFRLIPFKIHGAIELVAGIFVLVAPWIFGFAGINAPRNFFIVVGVVILLVFALTDYSQRVELPPPDPNDRRRWRGATQS
ncbi:MAG: SPW repeat domain-containing protein [Gemmatimonadaceae bacterium]